MAAGLDHPAAVQHVNTVGHLHSGEAVADEDSAATAQKLAEMGKQPGGGVDLEMQELGPASRPGAD